MDYQDAERRRDSVADYAEVQHLAASGMEATGKAAERMAAVAWAEAHGLDPKWMDRMLSSHQRKAGIRNMGYDPDRPNAKPVTLGEAVTGGTFFDGLSEAAIAGRVGPKEMPYRTGMAPSEGGNCKCSSRRTCERHLKDK